MRFLTTFALFLLIAIAIVLPFGCIIAISIGKYCGFSINIGIFSGICSYFSVKRSDNTTLAQNVDALDICKRHQNRHLPELIQQLILKLHICNVTLL